MELLQAFLTLLYNHKITRYQKIKFLFLVTYSMHSITSTNVRSLYYQFPDLFHTSDQARLSVKQLTALLKCTSLQLNYTATAKGLCLMQGYQQLIDDTLDIDANFTKILILEKDTIFQKFRQFQLPDNLLLVTAKGFPDA